MNLIDRKIDLDCLRITKNIVSSLKDNELSDKQIVKKTLQTLNGNSFWKLYEYYTCKKYNIIHWDFTTFDQRDFFIKKRIVKDCGIDGISEDCKTSLQSKYRDNT